jgi:hypothetical protein
MEEGEGKAEKAKGKKKIRTKVTIKNDDDQLSEVKLTDFPTQDIKNTSPQASKQTFKFW